MRAAPDRGRGVRQVLRSAQNKLWQVIILIITRLMTINRAHEPCHEDTHFLYKLSKKPTSSHIRSANNETFSFVAVCSIVGNNVTVLVGKIVLVDVAVLVAGYVGIVVYELVVMHDPRRMLVTEGKKKIPCK